MYTFPHIKTIDDVLPHIDEENFIFAERDGYNVINYILSNSETFPHSFDLRSRIRRECRGITFDKNGKLIRRPYHKFFNMNEREETLEKIIIPYISCPESISLDKVDGSMIAPAMIGSDIVPMTKMGYTDVAKNCENFLSRKENSQYYRFIRDWISEGFTPIFEWVSPENKIVIRYEFENLILCAIRSMHSGVYLSYSKMKELGERYNIDIVAPRTTLPSANVEGIVYRFGSGHMIKVKTEWYTNLHKMKSDILYEKNVVSSILNSNIDDVKPFLDREDLEKIEDYEKNLSLSISSLTSELMKNYNYAKSFLSRKEFGLARKNSLVPFSSIWDSFIFKNWDFMDEHLAKNLIINEFLRATTSNSKFESFKNKMNISLDW